LMEQELRLFLGRENDTPYFSLFQRAPIISAHSLSFII
jgi:hypothetical protein